MSSIVAEIEYTNEDGDIIHSDLHPENGVDQFAEENYRKLLHDSLDEWLDNANGTGHFQIMEDPNKTWTFFWLDGKRDVFTGTSPVNALNEAGFGQGAIAALDFYAAGDDNSYKWDGVNRRWVKNE